jgi:hypothetical protein
MDVSAEGRHRNSYTKWRNRYPTREACDASDDCMGRWRFLHNSAECRLCAYAYAAANNLPGAGTSAGGKVSFGDKTLSWSHSKQKLVHTEASMGF